VHQGHFITGFALARLGGLSNLCSQLVYKTSEVYSFLNVNVNFI